MPQLDWRPNEKQEEFLQLPDEVFEALYGGAAGPGKSEIIVLYPILREFYKHQYFKGIIFRRTFPELEAEILIRAHDYYPQTGAVWQTKSNSFYWPQYQSYMRFGHMDKEKDKKKYDSAEYQYAGFDELTHFTLPMYNYLYSRMRAVRCPTVKPIMRNGTNPGGVGHNWVRKHFVEPHREGRRLIADKETGRLRYYLPANLEDNPHLLRNDPDYVKNLMLLTPAERAAKMSGDWWTFQGQVFSFRRNRRPEEPEGACHVIPTECLPAGWPRFLATDIGFTAKNFSLWFAVSPDDEIFIYREHSEKGGLISRWAYDIAQITRGENLKGWEIDHTVFEGDRTDTKLVDDIHKIAQLDVYPTKAAKGAGSRVSGMKLIQEYLSWENSKGRPRLYIMDCCPELIECLPLCVFKKDKLDEEINDVQEFDGDDPYDTLRYGVKMCDRFIKNRRNNYGEERNEAQMRNLQENNDWFSYFVHRELQRSKQRSPRRRRVVV